MADAESTKSELKHRIEETKGQISDTVQNIQERIPNLDLKHQADEHPWRTFGIAIGVGFVLSGASNVLFKSLSKNFGNTLVAGISTAVLRSFLMKPEEGQRPTVRPSMSGY